MLPLLAVHVITESTDSETETEAATVTSKKSVKTDVSQYLYTQPEHSKCIYVAPYTYCYNVMVASHFRLYMYILYMYHNMIYTLLYIFNAIQTSMYTCCTAKIDGIRHDYVICVGTGGACSQINRNREGWFW